MEMSLDRDAILTGLAKARQGAEGGAS
jgi:hypothetical protein